MPFRFKRKESPTKAARRLSRERIGRARGYLQKSDRLETIHMVRREIKKVRATLELVRERIDERAYRKCAKTLRTSAKYLRDLREAHVRPRTLERLIVHFKGRLPARPFVGIKMILRQSCLGAAREFLKGESVATVDRLLRKMDRRARDLKVKADGWAAVQSGLRQSYRRGRKALAVVRKDGLPEHFHQWRKHVQDLWHQLRLLSPIQPAQLRVTAGKMKMLSRLLGDDHDLVMLRQFVTRHCPGKYPDEVRVLNQLIDLRQNELRAAALALGSRFYAEKASRFCRRLENYWRAWRVQKKAGN